VDVRVVSLGPDGQSERYRYRKVSGPAEMLSLLDELVAEGEAWFRAHPEVGHLYDLGIPYQREEQGSEDWQLPGVTILRGFGDCEDLSIFLSAWLRARGIDPQARPILSYRNLPGRGRLWHVQVERGSGKVEDPSRVCGMRGPDGEP
jgi:hypothetical protein